MSKISQPQLLALRALVELGGKATAAQVYGHLHPGVESSVRLFYPVHRTLSVMAGSLYVDRGWTRYTGKTIECWAEWEITEKGRAVLSKATAPHAASYLF